MNLQYLHTDFRQIVNNIRKLMNAWDLSLSELSIESGITVNGLKHMLENGKFKIDSLNKIASALMVPTVVLFAKELTIKDETIGVDEHMETTVLWRVDDINQKIQSSLLHKNSGFGGEYSTFNVIYKTSSKSYDDPHIDISTWKEKYEEIYRQCDDIKYDNLRYRAEKLGLEDKITYLEEKSKLYKDQAESYQLINEQLRDTIKEMKRKNGNES